MDMHIDSKLITHNGDVFEFSEGIYGFEDLRKFTFINQSENINNPFRLMVSLERPEVSFITVPPTFVHENYEVSIDDFELEQLGIFKAEDIIVFCIVTLAKDGRSMSVNLKSPVILSMATKYGKQIILEDSQYEIRHIVCLKSDS